MFREGKQAKVQYPTEGLAEDVSGRSFHNGRFVQRLRQAAASQPHVTVRQGVVTRLLDGEPAAMIARACLGLIGGGAGSEGFAARPEWTSACKVAACRRLARPAWLNSREQSQYHD